MISVDINKDKDCPFSFKKIEKIVKITAMVVKKIKGEVEINVVNDIAMKKINKQYRNINKTTDVLAFAWNEDKQIKSNILGQVYLSYPQIKKQAKEFNISVKEEFTRILVHGLLHVVGYDHTTKKQANKMFSLQEELVDNISKRKII